MHGSAAADLAPAQLLGDEDEALTGLLQSSHHGLLGCLVDRGRVVATLADTKDGLTLDAGGKPAQHALDVRRAGATRLEPGVHESSGWKRRPESGLGKKYVLFGGMRSPRRADANTSPMRGARTRNATSASPRSTAATASAATGV